MVKKSDKKVSFDFLGTIEKLKPGLKEETVHAVFAVIFFIAGVVFILASLGKAGVAGDSLYSLLKLLFGVGYFLLPILFFILGISFVRSIRPDVAASHIIGSALFLLSGLGIIEIAYTEAGGIIGGFVSRIFVRFFEIYTSLVALSGILVISLFVIFDARPTKEMFLRLVRFFRKKKGENENVGTPVVTKGNEQKDEEMGDEKGGEKESAAASIGKMFGLHTQKKDDAAGEDEILINPKGGKSMRALADYSPPPLSIFEKDRGKPDVGDIKANANIIKRTLQNFGIDVEMDEVSIGPTVTRYSLKPAEGVKLSRIVGLKNDLSLALAAHPIRIEAPIPGKSLVGVEIPNVAKTTVGLSTLFSDTTFTTAHKSLMLALGRAVSGKSIFANLSKMPHLLIAGATGSGKSVTIHAIINSLLFRNPPEDMRFIMIDPKRVELTLYNKIPHLLTPVITDAKKAILSLRWAAKEMERRYDILETESVRDIESYHNNVVIPAYAKRPLKNLEDGEFAEMPERMPYIIIVIDELADIMATYPRELEAGIVRLAQMSRAVGIHLILSTQRPSVNVITGLIKANIPARIALQVASQIDSRTILDQGGAETLLGSGDMLYISGDMSKPERIQSAYISEQEVKKVASYLASQYKNEVPGEISMTETENKVNSSIFDSDFGREETLEDDDDLYEEAWRVVSEAGKASSSYLQRKLKIGYARAARLIDMLEERGVIGKGEGAKPREVLVQPDIPTRGAQTDENKNKS